jgi:hypothetical protein
MRGRDAAPHRRGWVERRRSSDAIIGAAAGPEAVRVRRPRQAATALPGVPVLELTPCLDRRTSSWRCLYDMRGIPTEQLPLSRRLRT